MQTVVIQEEACVGCMKCIQACPVDAIVGSAGMMHTVIPDLCIGCGLCINPCPMDCIEWGPNLPLSGQAKSQRAVEAKQRFKARAQRLSQQNQAALLPPDTPETQQHIQSDLQAALERVRRKRVERS